MHSLAQAELTYLLLLCKISKNDIILLSPSLLLSLVCTLYKEKKI